MISSMTAFARSQYQTKIGLLCWEIKSVNHRFLDIRFHLPPLLQDLENIFVHLVKNKFNRGKIECFLNLQEVENNSQVIHINHNLLHNLQQISHTIAKKYEFTNDLSLSFFLNWPGVLTTKTQEDKDLSLYAEQALEQGLINLLLARQSEGEKLRIYVVEKLLLLEHEINNAKIEVKNIKAGNKEKLLTRLRNIAITVDENRVEQELALFLTRSDVEEELNRLSIHAVELTKILTYDGAVGRKLDFLLQELNREANTLSAKSDAILLTQSVVEMKVLIEQIREQVQNIE